MRSVRLNIFQVLDSQLNRTMPGKLVHVEQLVEGYLGSAPILSPTRLHNAVMQMEYAKYRIIES